MALPKPGRNLPRRGEDNRKIGLALLGEWRRERNQDCVGIPQRVVIGGRVERPLIDSACSRSDGTSSM